MGIIQIITKALKDNKNVFFGVIGLFLTIGILWGALKKPKIIIIEIDPKVIYRTEMVEKISKQDPNEEIYFDINENLNTNTEELLEKKSFQINPDAILEPGKKSEYRDDLLKALDKKDQMPNDQNKINLDHKKEEKSDEIDINKFLDNTIMKKETILPDQKNPLLEEQNKNIQKTDNSIQNKQSIPEEGKKQNPAEIKNNSQSKSQFPDLEKKAFDPKSNRPKPKF